VEARRQRIGDDQQMHQVRLGARCAALRGQAYRVNRRGCSAST
jgi:hypothetical protein